MLSLGSLTSNANSALSPLEQFGRDLLRSYERASTGRKVNSAADNPSGLAIATSLSTQAAAFDQGAQNAAIAGSALNVAQGALQATTDALQSLRSLAVSASNDLLSPADRNNLQQVANQLVHQINTDAQNANFNGTNLLAGPFSQTPPAPVDANVTANSSLADGQTLVSNVNPAANAQSGTIGVSVVNGGTGIAVTFTDNTGTTTNLGVQTPGSTITVNGTTLTLGNTGATDNGATATVQVTAAVAGTNAPQAQVQTGANEGATTGISLPNATSTGLLIGTINLSSTASATNAIGQIDTAIGSISSIDASIGAQSVALQSQTSFVNQASNQLTASSSNITDASASQTSTELYKLLVQQQISLATLQSANTEFGYLNRFFNTAA